MEKTISRGEALELLQEYNKTESLIKHGLAVEGVMAHFAELLNEDVEYWGVVGLLHDLDYEQYPEEHCVKVVEILKERGIGEDVIKSIVSHGYGICSEVKPEHIMEKVLYTIDELTGLINASVLMRPSKDIKELEFKSLNKKFKTASFASGVDREVILKGCEMLDMEFKYVAEETVNGMVKVAKDLGLDGIEE